LRPKFTQGEEAQCYLRKAIDYSNVGYFKQWWCSTCVCQPSNYAIHGRGFWWWKYRLFDFSNSTFVTQQSCEPSLTLLQWGQVTAADLRRPSFTVKDIFQESSAYVKNCQHHVATATVFFQLLWSKRFIQTHMVKLPGVLVYFSEYCLMFFSKLPQISLYKISRTKHLRTDSSFFLKSLSLLLYISPNTSDRAQLTGWFIEHFLLSYSIPWQLVTIPTHEILMKLAIWSNYSILCACFNVYSLYRAVVKTIQTHD